MRILKVTQAYYPFLDKGGPVVKVRALAAGLARRGHRVTVLTADYGFAKFVASAGKAEKHSRGWRAVEESGVEALYLHNWARHRSLTLNPGVLSFCAGSLREFDLAHIYGLYDLLGPAVGFACLRHRIPYVLEPMGMFLPIVRSLRLKHAYHALLGRRLIHGARRLIATSDQEARELFAGGMTESQLFVRRNGIEVPSLLAPPESFRRVWKIPSESRVVLFLGRLVSKKSPDLLLKAFAKWRNGALTEMPAMLVIAGPDEGDGYLQELKDLTRQLGIANSVLFTGPLYGDAKWAAYRDADVFVLPSQSENFGNTAGEAAACGTPVIVTERCGIAPLIKDRAGIVIPYSAEALEAALSRMLNGRTPREDYRDGCAEVARGLSWDEPLSQMEKLYFDLNHEAA